MNIGQKINEFDNSTGTVEEFNKFFPYSPVKRRTGFLEIGDIVGVGREATRLITAYESDMEGNEIVTTFEHDLTPVIDTENYREAGATGGKSKPQQPRYLYTACDLEGNELASAYKLGLLADKLGVGESYTRKRGNWGKKDAVKNPKDFIVKRRKL